MGVGDLDGCDSSLPAAGGGYSAVAPFVAKAMDAGSVPALNKDQVYLFTQLDSGWVGVHLY